MIDLTKTEEPFVAFVGAGASVVHPSYLPTWNGFNDLFLECLCERIADFSANRQPTEEMLKLFQTRRADENSHFGPDFQAQLVEDEIGSEYFRVWQSIDSSAYGPVHEAIADLAWRGRLGAIITTNFDRLIEAALIERGVKFEIFHDRKTFDKFDTLGKNYSHLPVIKIHGSLEDSASLVDTLRQRIIGRPASLTREIKKLLEAYPWLFLGFSGADFSYDRHYLGILDAAKTARGFVFLKRKESRVNEGVRLLLETYGEDKSKIVEGDLSNWVSDTFALCLTSTTASEDLAVKEQVHRNVKEKIKEWVDSCGDVSVINMVCALLKSSGMERQAHWLLRKTWKSYRTAIDIRSPDYARYNHNYGLSLLNAGLIRNPIRLAEDQKNLLEYRKFSDQNAFEFFARAYDTGKLNGAGIQLACVLAYRGQLVEAYNLAADATQRIMLDDNLLQRCDTAIASAVFFDILQTPEPAVEHLEHCLAISKKLGDEPRRAILSAHLGRFLSYSGRTDEAEKVIDDAVSISSKLGLPEVSIICQATQGLWYLESGKSVEDAIFYLKKTAAALHAIDDEPLYSRVDISKSSFQTSKIKGQSPLLCRVLLDLNLAGRKAGNIEIMAETLRELGPLTRVFRGYRPHYYLSFAACCIVAGNRPKKLTDKLIRFAVKEGERSNNPWVTHAAEILKQQAQQGNS